MEEHVVKREKMLDLLSDAFGVPANGRNALTAKIRKFSDLGLPTKGRKEAHSRQTYGLREMVELSMALSLTNNHIPPIMATRYVIERWQDFSRLACANLAGTTSNSRPYDERWRIAAIPGNILNGLGQRKPRGHASEEPEEVVLAERIADVDMTRRCAWIIIDASRFMPRISSYWVDERIPIESRNEALRRLVD